MLNPPERPRDPADAGPALWMALVVPAGRAHACIRCWPDPFGADAWPREPTAPRLARALHAIRARELLRTARRGRCTFAISIARPPAGGQRRRRGGRRSETTPVADRAALFVARRARRRPPPRGCRPATPPTRRCATRRCAAAKAVGAVPSTRTVRRIWTNAKILDLVGMRCASNRVELGSSRSSACRSASAASRMLFPGPHRRRHDHGAGAVSRRRRAPRPGDRDRQYPAVPLHPDLRRLREAHANVGFFCQHLATHAGRPRFFREFIHLMAQNSRARTRPSCLNSRRPLAPRMRARARSRDWRSLASFLGRPGHAPSTSTRGGAFEQAVFTAS